jgi:hypothetical protein
MSARLGPRPATDEQETPDRDAGRPNRIEAVGEPTQQSLDGGAREGRRLGGRWREPVQRPGGVGAVRYAFPFRYGTSTSPPAPAGADRASRDNLGVIDAKMRATASRTRAALSLATSGRNQPVASVNRPPSQWGRRRRIGAGRGLTVEAGAGGVPTSETVTCPPSCSLSTRDLRSVAVVLGVVGVVDTGVGVRGRAAEPDVAPHPAAADSAHTAGRGAAVPGVVRPVGGADVTAGRSVRLQPESAERTMAGS